MRSGAATRRALASLTGEGDSFAILSRDEMTYIQTSGGKATGFVLEYQAGSPDQHFHSAETDLDLEAVTRAFERYAADDPSWRSVATWLQDTSSEGSGRIPLPALVLVGIAILGLAIWMMRGA